MTELLRNSLLLAACSLAGCATGPQPVDTSAVAATFVDACMGSWAYSPRSSENWEGTVELVLTRDFHFEGHLGDKSLAGTWEAFGTTDAGVRMRDAATGMQIELVECPGDRPTLFTNGEAGDLSMRRGAR